MESGRHVVLVSGASTSLGDGSILICEHLAFDFTSRLQPAPDPAFAQEPITLGRLHAIRQRPRHSLASLRAADGMVLGELLALRDACGPAGCTVVDCTAPGSGRDPAALLALSERSGVGIVMAAGVSVDEATRAPEEAAAAISDGDAMQDDDVGDDLADRLVAELTVGVAVPGRADPVRAGVLTTGEVPALAAASSLAPDLARARTAALRAVGRAQMRSGAPVLLPLPARPADGAGAVEAVRVLTATHGAAAAALVVVHAQNLLTAAGRPAVSALLGAGVTLCFDGFGAGWSVSGADFADAELSPPPTDESVAQEVAALSAAGHAAQLVVSHGVCSSLQLAALGGAGLTHVMRSVLPRLSRSGVGAAALERLRSANAKQLLRWWTPAERAPRVLKAWECAGCHTKHYEAANPAEALPSDHIYYEKFEHRYCSTSCLSAHRKASFVVPFQCAPPAGG